MNLNGRNTIEIPAAAAAAQPDCPPFSLLIKPAGADCNLRCDYCFYLGRAALYPTVAAPRMSLPVLEHLIAGFMALNMPQHVFGWQGGEPMLMGVGFFQAVTRLQQQYGRAGAVVANGLQTNGTLIDDAAAEHLERYNFLVGVSLDGPPEIHDRYRRGVPVPGGGMAAGSHAAVMRGIDILRRHNVEFNILSLVTAANARSAAAVYRYLCDQRFFFQQYIPCVEFDAQGRLRPFAVTGAGWGEFLCALFDCWREDAGRVSIRLFDSILSRLLKQPAGMCSMDHDCRQYFLVEHNGDVYPCDFFVDPHWRLGNVTEHSWETMRRLPLYAEFGRRKTQWSKTCADCEWLEFCAGDCPKHRGACMESRSRLCEGWRMFFRHAMPGLRALANDVRARQMPATVAHAGTPPRNAPCPCGSGLKFKHCCGR